MFKTLIFTAVIVASLSACSKNEGSKQLNPESKNQPAPSVAEGPTNPVLAPSSSGKSKSPGKLEVLYSQFGLAEYQTKCVRFDDGSFQMHFTLTQQDSRYANELDTTRPWFEGSKTEFTDRDCKTFKAHVYYGSQLFEMPASGVSKLYDMDPVDLQGRPRGVFIRLESQGQQLLIGQDFYGDENLAASGILVEAEQICKARGCKDSNLGQEMLLSSDPQHKL